MRPFKGKMLASTVLPAVSAVGLDIAGAGLAAKVHAACKPCAPKRSCNSFVGKKGYNPCEAKKVVAPKRRAVTLAVPVAELRWSN